MAFIGKGFAGSVCTNPLGHKQEYSKHPMQESFGYVKSLLEDLLTEEKYKK